MIKFEINGVSYQTSKMDVFIQWGVARRLAPVIAGILTPDVLKQSMALVPKTIDGQTGNPVIEMDKVLGLFSGVFNPFIEALAKMPDADNQYVIDNCLACVQREQKSGGWATVKPIGNSLMMFNDIDLLVMMQLVFRVILDSVGNFSFASLSNLLPPIQE